MKTDNLLNLYQSYTLTKVSELNKQSLIALYAQNEQLGQLNKELIRANRTTEQILRNQIKEIEQKEKRRYYKNMTFNLSQALDLLENEENVNFRIFASGLFLSPIRDMAKDAVQELEEIADKEYAQNIVKRTNVLFDKNKSNIDNYNKTSWGSLLTAKSQIDNGIAKEIRNKKEAIRLVSNKINEIQQKAKENKKAEKGCFGCLQTMVFWLVVIVIGTIFTHEYEATWGAIILLLPALLLLLTFYLGEKRNKKDSEKNDEKNNVRKKKENSEEENLEKELEYLSDELLLLQQEETRLTTQYNELLHEITADCPKWESKLSKIADFIPHKEQKKLKNLDPLFTEAAKFIIKKKDTSTSLIQRKFAIGYNRAGRIINQLEECGIVGTEEGSKSRRLLCESEEELSELIKALT